VSKIGLNVALNLSTSKFTQNLDKAKGDMRKFASDIKRQNEVLGKLGMAGLGRGFGIAGGLAEGFAMGGIGGTVAAVAAPIAALIGFTAFLENINDFRRQSVDALKKFNADMASGKVGELVTKDQSAFVLGAAQQQALQSPGAVSTFTQAVASGEGGTNFLSGLRGAAGGLGELVNMLLENPTPGGFFKEGGMERVTAGVDVGMAQNTAQAQVAWAQLEELRKQTAAMQGN